MSDAFFGRLVPSEDLVIKTASLAISLKKVSADDVKGLDMEEGPSKFKFPSNLGNMGGANVNAKVNRPVLSRCPLKIVVGVQDLGLQYIWLPLALFVRLNHILLTLLDSNSQNVSDKNSPRFLEREKMELKVIP